MSNEYEIADIYSDLRENIFTMSPSDIGLGQSEKNVVWGVLMETGYPESVATLVTIADGSVSLYFGNGGGYIGLGEYNTVLEASQSFLSLAPEYIKFARKTTKTSLPKKGNTRFYFLTYDGIYSVENKEDDLENGRLDLSPLFLKAHEVITQLRLAFEQREIDFQNLMHAVTTGDSSETKRLLNTGANINNSDDSGLSPLMAAAFSGKVNIIKLLIEFSPDIDAKDNNGYTALMFASNAGNIESAELLIKGNADINLNDKDGSTPIMFAAQHGYNELVSLLLKNGADPNLKGSHGLSAIDIAKQNGHKKTIGILVRE